ncbi:MAG: sensor histidine kinase [Lachnospiraceae bacterium]
MQKKQRFWNLLLLFIGSICIFLSWKHYDDCVPETYYNKARVLLSEERAMLEEGKMTDFKPVIAVDYYLLDLGGIVKKEQGSGYEVGQKVNLTEALQTDSSYYKTNKDRIKVAFPIEKRKRTVGFAIFLLNRDLVSGDTRQERFLYIFSPILVMTCFFVVLCIYRTEYLNRHFVRPMAEISRSANAIVKGNYDLAVVKNHSKKVLGSATDKFVYAFEQMRDELKHKSVKEAELKRMQKEMISCISHDLRTPLSTIKAYASGIYDGIAVDEKMQKEYAEVILKKADVMEKMMKELLDQTNAEINELSIKKKEQYAKTYFDQIIKEIMTIADQKKIHFEAENRVPEMMVSIDAGRITQVIYNLVENSMKYMEKEEKKLRFQAEYDRNQKWIVVSVSDNGPGIGISDIPFVFDKFYRAEKSRSMQIPGAGLGLSICKYIVEAHGGEIWLESKTEEGCTFTFTILT